MSATDDRSDLIAELEARLERLRRESEALCEAPWGPVARIDVDAQGRVLSITRRAMELLRCEGCVSGRELSSLFPEGQGSELRECMQATGRDGGAEHYCLVHGRVVGGEPIRWLRAEVVRATGGHCGCTLILTDVSDLVLHRRELAGDAGMYETLLQVAGVEFFEWQADGRFRSSGGLRALIGVGPDSPLADPLRDWVRLVHPEDRERMLERWSQPRSGTLPPTEYRLLGEDGRIRWLRSAAIVRTDGNGRLLSISGVARDVSAEHAARALAAERAAILDVIPDIVVEIDREGAVTYLNPVAERYFRETPLGRNPAHIDEMRRDEPNHAVFDAQVEEVLERGERVRFRVTGAAHPTRPLLDVVATPVRDERGGIGAVLIAARDVSRLAQAEVEARAALLRLRTLIDTARGAIVVLDDTGRIELANRAFCQAVGLPQSQVVGSHGVDFCFPEEDAQRREVVRKLLAAGACSFPWRLRCGDDKARWFQVDGSTFGDSASGRRQFVFIAADIELARRERDALVERERWLDRVLDDAGIGAFRFDRERALGEVIGAYARLLRQTRVRLLNREELEALLPAAHRQRVGAQLQRLTEQPGRATMDFPLEFADGEQRWLRAFLRNEGDSRSGLGTLSSVIFDITHDRRQAAEHEELQRQVYQAQKTESLGVMAGGIAHDLNNMLMAALGQLNLAVAAVPPQSALGQYLATVESVLGRMEGLTERMLAYAGQSSVRMQPLDLACLLEQIEPLLRASCGRHARWRMEIEARPLWSKADTTQLEQVVLNFVQNAVDAIGEAGGSVRLRLGRVDGEGVIAHLQWPLEAADGYAVLSVRDDGPGIAPETLRRIFEPFYTTKSTGRGLGLAVVQGIIKAHGGSIRVLSEPGIGTEFRVYLPLLAQSSDASTPASEHSSATAPTAADSQAPVTVPRKPLLVIDDDEDVLSITVVMLEQCGFEVAAFLCGDDAVLELARHPERYGGAIIDLTMPVKSGVEIARELRQQAPDLPLLFVSGYAKELPGAQIADIAGARFLRKPFRAEALACVLEEMF
ncbi:MAG: PAS domain S-box protein [Xanthomonadales bacterium]|nr:Adaptive-response sensory-kinase SasA [Xanthomonadales bacterium]MCC6592889.1 PAS domain S-box protein [Xanthomonadales bacterium]MCE7930782.1 PAS domain S-box protein [Xanthomonadales bacterium PRO6]